MQNRCSSDGAGKWLVMLLCLAWLLLAVRIAAPSDIYDNEQPEQLGFVADAAFNGHWLCQWTVSPDTGVVRITPKPPMYTWLAAAGIRLTGWYGEWMYKLPSIAGALLVALLVYDLARRSAGHGGAALAAGFWLVNYQVYKLFFTARSDMLLTAWIMVGLWALLKARACWLNGDLPRLWQIWLFWFAMALGTLTKGPIALFPCLMAVLLISWDGAWRQCRLGWHVPAVLLVPVLFGGWFYLAYTRGGGGEDLYYWIFQESYMERIANTGISRRRSTPVLAVPLYFLRGLAPWTVLMLTAAVAWLAFFMVTLLPRLAWAGRRGYSGWLLTVRRVSRCWRWWPYEVGRVPAQTRCGGVYSPVWALVWVVLVVGLYMIPQGRRADYITPALFGGALVAGHFVASVIGRRHYRLDDVTWVVHLFLLILAGLSGCLALLLILGPAVLQSLGLRALVPVDPLDVNLPLVRVMGVGLLVLGLLLARLCCRRQYVPGALVSCFCVTLMLGGYGQLADRSARTQAGEQQKRLAVIADQLVHRSGLPIVFYDTGYTAVQMLMGLNRPDVDVSAFDAVAPGREFLLITSARALADGQVSAYIDRSQIVTSTGLMPESERSLVLMFARRRSGLSTGPSSESP